MKLSERLQMLYEELIPGLPVWDLCCDHGYLGMQAYLSKQFPEVYFVDQVPFAMKEAEKKFDQYVKNPLNSTQANFITSDVGKLERILSGNVVAAGVGGINMMIMLEKLWTNQKLKPRRLILSPHRNDELYQKPELFGLPHTHTKTVVESGFTRSIFVFTKP